MGRREKREGNASRDDGGRKIGRWANRPTSQPGFTEEEKERRRGERKPKPAPQRKILGTEERGERSLVSGRLITAAAEEIDNAVGG